MNVISFNASWQANVRSVLELLRCTRLDLYLASKHLKPLRSSILTSAFRWWITIRATCAGW